MNIGSISTNISTSDIKNDVQVAMLKKSLDTIETSGNDMIKMMGVFCHSGSWTEYRYPRLIHICFFFNIFTFNETPACRILGCMRVFCIYIYFK